MRRVNEEGPEVHCPAAHRTLNRVRALQRGGRPACPAQPATVAVHTCRPTHSPPAVRTTLSLISEPPHITMNWGLRTLGSGFLVNRATDQGNMPAGAPAREERWLTSSPCLLHPTHPTHKMQRRLKAGASRCPLLILGTLPPSASFLRGARRRRRGGAHSNTCDQPAVSNMLLGWCRPGCYPTWKPLQCTILQDRGSGDPVRQTCRERTTLERGCDMAAQSHLPTSAAHVFSTR